MALKSYIIGASLFLRAVPAIATNDDAIAPVFTPKKIISGSRYTCALSTAGQVKCWGSNGNGELGIGSTAKVGNLLDTMGPNLQAVNLGKDIIAKDMCAGSAFSCAVTTTGGVKCWGVNTSGQLGQELTKSTVGNSANDMGDNLPWTNLGSEFVAAELQQPAHSTLKVRSNAGEEAVKPS